MANVTKVKELIEKSKHYDADERFMAILDLIEQIKQAAAIDPIIQSIIRDAVLKALDDGSSDVATCAVKCLSELVPKLLAEQTTFVIESLGRLLVDKEKSSRRDIVTDGLKSVIHCLSIDQGKDGAAKLVKNLISGLSHTPTKDIEMEMACLTVLKELLERFGNDLAEFHSQLLSVLQPLLDHPSDSVRKAASEALGPLVLVLDDKSFTSLMDHIVAAITNKGKRPETYIQAVSAISRAAGVRVGPFLHSLVPQLASYLPKEKVNKEQTEATEELWETVLIAFESLLISCPAQIRDYVPQILHISLEMAKHDPLFIAPAADENNHKPASGGDDEWGNDGGDDGWGDSGDAKGADGWGDDDGTAAAIVSASGDASWRVRRSAVRVISAVIRSKYDKLKDFYLLICKVLVDRFRERDGAVKEEVLLAAREAVRESVVVGKIEAADDSELPSLAIPLLQRQKSVTEILIEVLPDLMKALLEQFNGADVRTRRALFAVLSELLIVRRGVSLDDYLNALVPHVIAGVEASGKTSEVSADAIRVLHLLFEYHKELPSLSNHLNAFSSSLVNAIKNGLPKNIPDALSAISALSRILHGKSVIDEAVNELFSVTFHELQQKDVPLNVKLASLHTISVIVYHHGDLFPSMVPKVIVMLIERLNNDATRQPTLKAIHKIAHSSIKFDLSPIVNHTEEMVSFMRKAFHHIKDDTVRAFESLIKAQPSLYSSKDIQSIVGEASQHLADTDLQLAHNILDLATTIVSHCPSSHEIIAANILPRIVRLVSSPLLQGSALHALVKFLQTCTAHSKNAQLTFDSLLSLLLAQVNADLSKSAAASIAKCIAGITLKSSSLDATVHRFIDLADPKNPKHDQVQVALLTLGDIGKSHDLSNHKQIVDVLLKSFDASNENVRSAGAFALGNSTAGNMNVFLPTLIQLCKTRTSHVYLLFSSLREVITAFSGTEKERARLQVHVPSITPLLFDQAEAKDEAVRSMAAECLGRLAIIEPEKLLISLAELLSRKSELARGVAISAVRFALSDVIDPSLLKARLTPFVKLINDPDLEVRRQCFLTIVAILRFNSSLFSKELMEDVIIPSLYSETQPKPELIYEMDYGAFKKKVDTGKSVRKAAFQCLATLVEVSADRLKLSEFIDHVKHGLIDEEDIQISTYQIFIYVAQNHGTALLEFLDALPKFIMATVKAHLAAAKSQTADPAVHECLRSIVRALASFNAIVGIQLCKDFIHFSRQVAATEPLKPYIQELTGKK